MSKEPGWYDDTENPSMLRFWDGSQWTNNRHPAPVHPVAEHLQPSSTEPDAGDNGPAVPASVPSWMRGATVSESPTPEPKKEHAASSSSRPFSTIAGVVALAIAIPISTWSLYAMSNWATAPERTFQLGFDRVDDQTAPLNEVLRLFGEAGTTCNDIQSGDLTSPQDIRTKIEPLKPVVLGPEGLETYPQQLEQFDRLARAIDGLPTDDRYTYVSCGASGIVASEEEAHIVQLQGTDVELAQSVLDTGVLTIAIK